MHAQKITHNDIELAYEVYGKDSGKPAILCFHGHARKPEDFRDFAIKNRKIISFYLFFHGPSRFDKKRVEQKNRIFSTEDLKTIIEKVLAAEKVEQFHLLAYSQGGRFALSLTPLFKKRIKSLFLIAPDGMNNYNFYSLTQRQAWSRALFRRWTKKPKELMSIVKGLVKVKVIPPKMNDFFAFYADDPKKLQRAYLAWAGFRKLIPDYKKISTAIQEENIRFKLVIGKYDQIITQQSGRKFLKKIHQENEMYILEFGHDIFKPDIKKQLVELFDFENGEFLEIEKQNCLHDVVE